MWTVRDDNFDRVPTSRLRAVGSAYNGRIAMQLRDVKTISNPPCAVASLETPGSAWQSGDRGVREERTWRCLTDFDRGTGVAADILVSRWVDSRSSCRHEQYVSPSDRYIIGVSLRTTRLRLTRGPHTIFDGVMPAGTLHVTGPSQQLTAD